MSTTTMSTTTMGRTTMGTTTATTDYFQVQLYPPAEAMALAKTRLLIPLGNITEIITVQQQDLCPLPGLPRGVLGVLNLRGQLLWVMDLRLVQGQMIPKARQNPQEKLTVVLLHGEQGQIGCLVDSLQGITAIAPGDLQPIALQWTSTYSFCTAQLSQGDGFTGFVLVPEALFRHLQEL